ncbi:hypothetical protein JCM15519_02810 [Fundidesulfovibrio butyratiphilus]
MTERYGPDLLYDPEIAPKLMAMLDHSAWAVDLDVEDVEHLAKYLCVRRFSAGDTIFHEGDNEDSMAIILMGTVEISKRNTSPQAQAKQLVLLGPGRAFGEMALIQGPPRSATAKAKDDTTLLVLSRACYDVLCRENKPLALKFTTNIARLISFRLRNTSERLVEYL